MRIIAGNLKNKSIKSPGGTKTHPMSEKIRGAIFNALGDIEGLSVLDAYSGSGALSLEAVSRGAAKVVAIDIDKNATDIVNFNVVNLDSKEKIQVTKANIKSWLSNNQEVKFDLILADPPFDGIDPTAIDQLGKHLSPGGILCLNWPGHTDLPEIDKVSVISTKKYGDAQLGFYK